MRTIVVALISIFIRCHAYAEVYVDTIVLNGGFKLFVSEKLDKNPEPTFDVADFMFKTLQFPDSARENEIQGRVLIGFTIDEEGRVTDPVIVSSLHSVLSSEVLRVIGKMPKWKPGSTGGSAKKVSVAMPISFVLETDGPRRIKRRNRRE